MVDIDIQRNNNTIIFIVVPLSRTSRLQPLDASLLGGGLRAMTIINYYCYYYYYYYYYYY